MINPQDVEGLCTINHDWPDALCMDQIVNEHFPQHQVDKWAEYYKYKGAEFMKSKKIEMTDAINSNKLLEWVDYSIQNENVWRYYYFSEQAPNPYQYLQGVGFEPIPHVNYVDFRDAQGAIMCEGYTSGGEFLEFPKCGPIDKSAIHILIVVLPIAGIIVGYVIIWKKRK